MIEHLRSVRTDLERGIGDAKAETGRGNCIVVYENDKSQKQTREKKGV